MLDTVTKLSGRSLIGFAEGTGNGQALHAWNPVTGEQLQPGFIPATTEEVDQAVRLATEEFHSYSKHTTVRE